MSVCSNSVTIYRLLPEEVELFLTAKYGGKIAAVNSARLTQQNQKRAKFDAVYRKSDSDTT